ncbi:MAG: acetate/propionate family kinase [Myxococcales bacterium]|nr:MAG: acetate/propionate family kinase [Myxococcales bacterium]
MSEGILALNAGSSTLKYSVYRFDGAAEVELTSDTLRKAGPAVGAVEEVLAAARIALGGEPSLVGHRVVHGGSSFTSPVELDEAVLGRIEQLTPLAPLHVPPALSLIRAVIERLPRARHVACFDTSFHRTLPEVARRFALPSELYEGGVRRYGFHGLSYEYVVQSLGPNLPRRLLVAHLGSGASMAAILGGRSLDTSMGLTPTGGLPMGTRSGDLDPGVLLHLLKQRGLSAEEVEELVDRESGLKGVAGSSDMSELVSRRNGGDALAFAAVELFSYAVKKQLGAYLAVLGGADCLVFTGGIGEHVPLVRELSLSGLASLGIQLDLEANRRNAPIISAPASPCQVRVVKTNEDLMIARHAFSLTRGG